MDAVDTEQQRQLDDIEKKNQSQDFWLKVIGIGFVGWIMIITTIMMIRLTQMNLPDVNLTQTK